MEEVTIITNAISNVGFPIVVSGALFWFVVKVVQPLSEAIARFTAVLERYERKLGDADE